MTDIEKMRETLSKIADLALDASCGGGGPAPGDDQNVDPDMPGCAIKAVPRRLLEKAASNATQVNPMNAPMMALAGYDDVGIIDPLRIAVMTTKYWGSQPRRLTVSFIDSASSASSALRTRILGHMNAWTRTGGISFVETRGTGNVRIAFGPTGHWSYLGTDVSLIPINRPTMNLQAFDRETRDSEFYRVVRHETGHTLGFPHEHMRKELVARIDPQKAYQYFWQTQRWDKAMVDQQVLTSLDNASLYRTPPDQTSIMCYQLPASITRDGRPIIGGTDINQTDYWFNGKIYPRQSGQTLAAGNTTYAPEEATPFAAATTAIDEWSETEDANTMPVE